jgi:hypothetical protein
MKSPRKNQNNKFICEECDRAFIKLDGLSKHISLVHCTKQEYYDKYLKDENEDICPVCGNKNPYLNRWDRGYKKTCSIKCENILRRVSIKKSCFKIYGDENYNNSEKRNETNIKKFGNKCPIQNIEIKEKSKQTCLKKFGVENPFQSSEIQRRGRKTKKEKYGDEFYIDREKSKKTCLEKYGVEHPSQNDEIFQKIKRSTKETTGYECNFQNRKLMNDSMMKKYGVKNVMQTELTQNNHKKTMLKKYGVEYSMQNIEIFTKAFKTRISLKQFKDTDIWYQGSYELDFLEKYYEKFPEIRRAPSIHYRFNKKEKVYHPDFYIPSLNLIIEIKNSYLVKHFRYLCNLKKKATIANGFNFIMIVNKKYNKFNKLYSKL